VTSAERAEALDPAVLRYVRAPARPGMPALALDDLPIVDRPGSALPTPTAPWPLPLVASQTDALAGGHLDEALGDIVCDLCASVLGQRIVWSGRPAVIGLVRGRRWSVARSWGRRPVSAMIAARQRGQWFCLLDREDTPAHLPLTCRTHGSLSVTATEALQAPSGDLLPVMPPGWG
jgi:hypothetical protein